VQRTSWRDADWLPWQWGRVLGVVYIALIGIFAIEELNGRNETMRLLLAEESRIAAQAAGDGPSRSLLHGVRQRLVSLIVSGSPDSVLTLRELHCELVSGSLDKGCPKDASHGPVAWIIATASTFLLKGLSAVAGSGQILGVLVVTASVGGALVDLSLRRRRLQSAGEEPRTLAGTKPVEATDESALSTVIRAIGGGIVCYLAIDGGTIPLTAADIAATTTHPATASLYGFLAGMFSERVFRLLSELVDAFLSRISPKREGSSRNASPAATAPGTGAAE
jgi:hypothetical protein